MKPHTHQTIQQTQRLTLTPAMQTAFQVLQLPLLESRIFVEQQLQDNPLLDIEDGSSNAPETDADQMGPTEDGGVFRELDDNVVEALLKNDPSRIHPAEDNEEQHIASQSVTSQTLHDLLRLQLGCLPLEPRDRQSGEWIIAHLDEHGYLSTPLEEVAQQTHRSLQELERLLEVIQTFDPPGAGARDLRECLLIQLHRRGQANSLAAQILRDHFPLFLQGQLKRLANLCHRPLAEIEAAFGLIRQLEPKPYRLSDSEPPRPIVPDVIVHRVDGHYEVELSDEQLPSLTINAAYRRLLQDPTTEEEVKRFLQERLRQAVWLMRAIEQRHATLLAIARCLIAVQRDFFEYGPQALKPLTQAQVAEAVGRHPSTVGRAIAGKYLHTPYGLLAMEQFFASRVPQDNPSQSVSDASVKAELTTLIAQEDPGRPFSDEALATRLRERGVTVARRTVAKYRGVLKILPAHLRRRAHRHAGGSKKVREDPS